MKIIHCLNRFLPHHIAGTEMYVYALCKSLNQNTFETVVVIPNYGEDKNYEYDYEGIRVIKYAEPSVVDRNLQMGKRKPDGVAAFEEILKKEKADIIHFHELAGSNGFTLHHVKAAKDAGRKIVMTFHVALYSCKTGTLMYKNETPCDGIISIKKCTLCNYKINGLSGSLSPFVYTIADLFHKLNVDASHWQSRMGTVIGYPLIIKKLKKDLTLLTGYCDKIAVLSKWYHDVLLKNKVEPGKMVFIKQGVFNYEKDQPVPVALSEAIRLIFVGRISHAKGIKMLIATLKNFDAQKIRLDIYGDSPEKNYIEECKKNAEAMKNISWKGRLSPGKVISTMSENDILCLPSTVCEMSPLVIQEAFAAGIPVIGSDVYGNAEQIQDGINGWLFNFNDGKDLCRILKKLIEHKFLIDEAKKNIKPVKPFDTIADEYVQIYNSVLNN